MDFCVYYCVRRLHTGISNRNLLILRVYTREFKQVTSSTMLVLNGEKSPIAYKIDETAFKRNEIVTVLNRNKEYDFP